MKNKKIILLLFIFMITFLPKICNSENIYKKFNTHEIIFVKGIVTEIETRYFVVEDDNENSYKIRLTDYTSYYPSDYSLNMGDSINVRTVKYSLITNKLYALEIQFLKENK